MSDSPLRLFDDPKQLDLINTVLEKTREGRLRWHRGTMTYTADLPNGVQLVFALSLPRFSIFPVGKRTWADFVVRRPDGTEILNVQHTTPSTLLEGLAGNPLQDAIKQLFTVVSESAENEVDKVIEQLKNL